MKKVTVQGKAVRLYVQASVNILEQGENWIVAQVKGDHDTYLVRLEQDQASCTCKWFQFKGWSKPCSHIEAAREEMNPLVAA